MFRQLLRAKLHRVTVTDANLTYEGSLTVDEDLIRAAGLQCYELVMVSNLNNGERFETYIIPGPAGSGIVTLNGPAARKGIVGDLLVIFCYGFYAEREVQEHRPTIVLVDQDNRVVSKHQPSQWDLETHENNVRTATSGICR